jgi:PAS domain S-box-containing protein
MDSKTIPLSEYFANIEKEKTKLPKLKKGWDDDLSYRALFEQTGEAIFIIGLDFRYINANQQALNLLGYEEDELIGKPVNEIVSQGVLEDNKIPNTQRSQLQERILKCKGGPTIPVEISTTIIYDNDEPAYIQSIARDISVKKNTERVLKQNALILSTISEATEKLLQSSDIDKKIPSVLEALGRIMKISCASIFTFKNFSNLPKVENKYIWENWKNHKVDITQFISDNIDLLINSDQYIHSQAVEGTQKDKNFNISFISFPIASVSGAQGYIGFFDDKKIIWSKSETDAIQTAVNLISAVLQRKDYEETIRLNEARNRILVDALPDLIIRIDTTGNILDYSANPEHPLYIHRDLAHGRNLKETFPEEVASQIIGKGNKTKFVISEKVVEFRLPYAKGIYEAQLYPIFAAEAIVLIRDITEQAKLNEMKSDFINRASHELRTPLTAAMLMVELIQDGGTAEEIKEYWHTLGAELRRQKTLIDRLLSAGRLESGMMGIESEPLSLMPILRESMQSVQPIIAKRQISLEIVSNHKDYQVLGDKSGLQQVFVNLMTNAAKFSPKGSAVQAKISKNDTHIKIAIIDKGVGIPEEDLPYLFQRFFRAKNVTIAEIPGSGIGLYIVNSIIKEMDGEITVKSIPDEGTTFTIHLKRADD